MAISTYTGLKTSIQNWIARSDLSAVVPDFIELAESRIYRDLRIRAMETALSSTIASGVIAVPSDYVELKFAYVDGTPVQPLQRTSQEFIYSYYPTRSGTEIPKYIATDGSNFIFGPYPGTYTIKGTYYAKLTALSASNETNWFTANAPQLILYGALIEAADYMQDEANHVRWSSKFEQEKARVQFMDEREMLSGSILTTRIG